MRYTIETTKNGCKEILEINDYKFERNHTRVPHGLRCTDEEIYEQMEQVGITDDDLLDKAYDLFSTFLPYDICLFDEMF